MSLYAVRRHSRDATTDIHCVHFPQIPEEGQHCACHWGWETLHGIRHGLGTGMTTSGTLIDVMAQVLGHKRMKAIKQYISADLQGMHNCTIDLGPFCPRSRSRFCKNFVKVSWQTIRGVRRFRDILTLGNRQHISQVFKVHLSHPVLLPERLLQFLLHGMIPMFIFYFSKYSF